MHPKLAIGDQMTIEEFLAFTDQRPDGERWELIEGRAVMNAAPADIHQIIVMNLVGYLRSEKLRLGASWLPMPGVGTRVPISPNSLPQPDAFVKATPATGSSVTDDALVLFEVLSKSNTKADQAWRRRVYSSVPNCQHYVTVSGRSVEVIKYDRSSGWAATEVQSLDGALDLAAIGVSIPLAEIYRWTPLGAAP